jgi:hypothetical protein
MMKNIELTNPELRNNVSLLAQKFGYNTMEVENGICLENTRNEPAFEFVRITPSNIADAKPILERYQNEYSRAGEYVIEYSRCLKLLARIANDLSLENVEFFIRGITFCSRLKLPQLFDEAIAPIFFGTFTAGEIIVVRTSLICWGRSSFQRCLYAFSHYPDAVTNQEINSFESLRKWNRVEADDFLSVILHLAQYLFFPYVSGFIAGHGIGLKLIFIPSQPFEHTRQLFPADWMDFLRSDTELAQESGPPSKTANELFEKPQRSIYGKYVFSSPPSANSTKELMGWAIGAANALVTRLNDVTNFTVADSHEIIDPVFGQEYSHSFMHILRDAVSIIAEDSRYRNKATTFRMADIISALAENGSLKKRPDEFFRYLFSDACKQQIRRILDGTGIAALQAFADTSDNIYQNLKKVVIDSVIIPNKRQGDKISVRTSSLDSERLLDEDAFKGQVLRSLRNTQHGYFSRGDSSMRPSRFLSLIDGNTPDDFPTLGLVWTVALLASPAEFIGEL